MNRMANKISLTTYNLRDRMARRAAPALRIAQVSDLHEADPAPVLSLCAQAKPDLILVSGDLLERHEDNASEWTKERMNMWQEGRQRRIGSVLGHVTRRFSWLREWLSREGEGTHPENAYQFLREAGKIAPVYYSVGNHEWYFLPEDYAEIQKNGVVLLDNADVEADTSAGPIRIGGLSTRCDLTWLASYAEKPGYKILLSHHPEYYEWHIKGTALDRFDLIFSGHAHGGQWRILGRGVFAPGQGFFPTYTRGIYDGRLIVSAGLSNTVRAPRFGNPCELVIVDI